MGAPASSRGRRGSVLEVAMAERDRLHYGVGMKRPNSIKLLVRRETIRALASAELARAVGGDTAELADSGKVMCPNLVLPKP